jgi:UDP-2,3-diacylglucosamine hydrolase
MESHAFFRAFGWLPGPIARPLDRILTWKNERGLLDDEERHLRVYRSYAACCRDAADIVIIGHVHRAVDESGSVPRLIVLGGWQHRSCYLRVDEAGATHFVIPDRESEGNSLRGGDPSATGRSPAPPGLRRAGVEESGFKIADSKSENHESFNQ